MSTNNICFHEETRKKIRAQLFVSGQNVTVLVSTISNSQIFLLKKCE